MNLTDPLADETRMKFQLFWGEIWTQHSQSTVKEESNKKNAENNKNITKSIKKKGFKNKV